MRLSKKEKERIKKIIFLDNEESLLIEKQLTEYQLVNLYKDAKKHLLLNLPFVTQYLSSGFIIYLNFSNINFLKHSVYKLIYTQGIYEVIINNKTLFKSEVLKSEDISFIYYHIEKRINKILKNYIKHLRYGKF